jgi:hypothetical protein
LFSRYCGWGELKNYVLGMMFDRYIFVNMMAYISAGEKEAGGKSVDSARDLAPRQRKCGRIWLRRLFHPAWHLL